ncbi:Protein CBG26001 [Caenorhabditis briggsae]|uniref:Protein CBG26001 n=1 Tax=Caenorhabditis briggsae TaxID=6238 RepID=B6IKV1_CAEBR|nr:Protein CBG26001 [Caenorhabditis briggsae]CAS00531.1 Protein CBG26001 [Caenorhabditis briggsae]
MLKKCKQTRLKLYTYRKNRIKFGKKLIKTTVT